MIISAVKYTKEINAFVQAILFLYLYDEKKNSIILTLKTSGEDHYKSNG